MEHSAADLLCWKWGITTEQLAADLSSYIAAHPCHQQLIAQAL